MDKQYHSPVMAKPGKAIRRYRLGQGLKQKPFAEMINYSDGWLSTVETGQHLPDRRVVERMEELLKITPGALTDLHDLAAEQAVPDWFRPWLPIERNARVLRWMELTVVPGLLQTEAYAGVLLKGDSAGVAARLHRQRTILKGDKPPTLRCVVDEAVLYRQVGSKEVMRDQLEHLVDSLSARVTVQVVPSVANPHELGAFILATLRNNMAGRGSNEDEARLAGHDQAVYIETTLHGFVSTSSESIRNLSETWKEIQTYTLSQPESVEFIRRMIEERWK